MLKTIPTPAMLEELLGPALYAAWQALCQAIEERYDMDRLWDSGGKSWTYEYKYRRGGKTLCSLYAKSQCFLPPAPAALQSTWNCWPSSGDPTGNKKVSHRLPKPCGKLFAF